MSKKILVQIQFRSTGLSIRTPEQRERHFAFVQELRSEFLTKLSIMLPSGTFEKNTTEPGDLGLELWIQMTEEDYLKFKPAIESLPAVMHVNRLDNTSISIDI